MKAPSLRRRVTLLSVAAMTVLVRAIGPALTSLGGAADLGALIAFSPDTGSWEEVGAFTGAAGAVPGELPGGELLVSDDGTVFF